VLIPRPETEHAVEQALRVWGGSPEPRGASSPRSGQTADVGQALACGGLQPAQAGEATVPSRSRLRFASSTSGQARASWPSLWRSKPVGRLTPPTSAESARHRERQCREARRRCRFLQCDLGSAFADRSFDLIVSNPPYIESAEIETLQREVREWEPREALDGGASGLDIYARLVPEAARLLRPGGWLILEIGATQGEAVPALFDASWKTPEVVTIWRPSARHSHSEGVVGRTIAQRGLSTLTHNASLTDDASDRLSHL